MTSSHADNVRCPQLERASTFGKCRSVLYQNVLQKLDRPGFPLHLLPNRPTKMSSSRQFFVGGNFKLNPICIEAKSSLIGGLNKADLDCNTGGWLIALSTVILFFLIKYK